MFYAGDEYADDDCTSGPVYDEGYCDYCEREGHTFSHCPARDDESQF